MPARGQACWASRPLLQRAIRHTPRSRRRADQAAQQIVWSSAAVAWALLPRRQPIEDRAILDFLLANVGWFDMYVEGNHGEYVRYCFEAPLDAEIFHARFDPREFTLAG